MEQVQADEIKVKTQGGTVWMAMRALCHPILVAVDGFSAYLKAFRDAFRSAYKGDKGGRPRLGVWEEVAIVQVTKRQVQGFFSI